MSEYPDSDLPFNFYFDGAELPRWSAHWHLCDLGAFLNGFRDEWDEFVSYRHIWHLQCRLDHIGITESEDPLIFRICAQEVLRVLLVNRREILVALKRNCRDESTAPEEIYGQIIEGIVRMLELCTRDGLAFWTGGYAADGERLNEELGLHQLGSDHPDHFPAPHVAQRRREQELRLHFQSTEIKRLALDGAVAKPLIKLLKNLP